jgi:hypothetical protein
MFAVEFVNRTSRMAVELMMVKMKMKGVVVAEMRSRRSRPREYQGRLDEMAALFS